jgi:hypothetical protein
VRKCTSLYPSLSVDTTGTGVVSHASAITLLRTAEKTGLTAGLSAALGPWRKPLATLQRLRSTDAGGTVLLRADSAFFGHPTVAAATRAGAQVSVTVRWDPKVNKAIAQIPEDAWAPIEYTDALFGETANTWVSRAEVAEIPFTAFNSKKTAQQVPGRLVVCRRSPRRRVRFAARSGPASPT